MHYILQTMSGLTYIISEDQHEEIKRYIEQSLKCFYIGKSLILTHQITGIDPLPLYRRQMKFKLAVKGLKLCDRCHTIMAKGDKCPCRDMPDKYPDVIEQAKLDNPKLGEPSKTVPTSHQLS